MNALAQIFLLPFVRLAWLFIADVTPKQTLDELGLALNGLRHDLFNQNDRALQEQLTTQLIAARAAYSALMISGASDTAVSAQAERVNTFDRLLAERHSARDAFLGSLSGGTEPSPGFQPVAEHPSTTGFLLGAAGTLAGRVLEDRDMKEQTIRLKERVYAERDVLTQMRSLMTQNGQAVVDARLQALDLAVATISTAAAGRAPSRQNAPPQSSANPQRESIDIV